MLFMLSTFYKHSLDFPLVSGMETTEMMIEKITKIKFQYTTFPAAVSLNRLNKTICLK